MDEEQTRAILDALETIAAAREGLIAKVRSLQTNPSPSAIMPETWIGMGEAIGILDKLKTLLGRDLDDSRRT